MEAGRAFILASWPSAFVTFTLKAKSCFVFLKMRCFKIPFEVEMFYKLSSLTRNQNCHFPTRDSQFFPVIGLSVGCLRRWRLCGPGEPGSVSPGRADSSASGAFPVLPAPGRSYS